jgi:hypothetical protein
MICPMSDCLSAREYPTSNIVTDAKLCTAPMAVVLNMSVCGGGSGQNYSKSQLILFQLLNIFIK